MIFKAFLLLICTSCASITFTFMAEHKAVTLYNEGKYQEALEKFEELLIEQPDNVELLYNAGKSAYREQEYKAAVSYYKQAMAHKNVCSELMLQASFDIGNAYVKLQEWHEALKSYEAVLTIDPEHKEAQDMIEKIKKLLDQQNQEKNQQDNQDQQQDSQSQDNQSQDKQSDQKNSPDNKNQQQKNDQEKQNKNSDRQDSGSQDESQGDEKKQDSSQSQKENSKQNKSGKEGDAGKDQSNTKEEKLDQKADNGKSSQNNKDKQDLHDKDTKESGQKVGQEGQSDKSDKDFKQDRGNKPKDSIPDIQDHEREESNFDHSASPHDTKSNSKEQNNSVAAKAQAKQSDPFAVNDDIDKNSPVGKMLQLIEDRDAQASQQLLKMNVQSHRRPGEKNW